jgi:hypothetical protein
MMYRRAAGGVVDGDAGVLLLDDAGAGLLDEHVGGEREDFAAGGHDLAHGDVVELDGAMDDLFLNSGSMPMRRAAVAMSLSSSGEWTAPSRERGAEEAGGRERGAFMRRTAGRVMRMKTSMGPATARAMRSARWRARDLGRARRAGRRST